MIVAACGDTRIMLQLARRAEEAKTERRVSATVREFADRYGRDERVMWRYLRGGRQLLALLAMIPPASVKRQ